MIVITDLFADIVKRVSERYGSNVSYMFGDWDYISSELTAWSKSPETAKLKYPAVFLYSPFDEDRKKDSFQCSASLDMLIAVNTLSEYTNEDRSVVSFDKCLRPIYGLLIEELKSDRWLDFGYKNIVEHMYTENYRYGRRGVNGSDGNPFNDRIDGIDIKNLNIKVRNKIRGGMYGNRI